MHKLYVSLKAMVFRTFFGHRFSYYNAFHFSATSTPKIEVFCMVCALSVFAFADDVKAPAVATLPRSISVPPMPASLPVYVMNGAVVAADNARITNNATSDSVQVTAIQVTDSAYKVGSYHFAYDNFSVRDHTSTLKAR